MAIQSLDSLWSPSASAQGLSGSNGLSYSKRLDCFVVPHGGTSRNDILK